MLHTYAPSRRKAKGHPIDNFLAIKKSQKMLSIFQMKKAKAKRNAPVPKIRVIVRFAGAGIRSAASDHLSMYVIRPAVIKTVVANTT
jgi:hypothetical protein